VQHRSRNHYIVALLSWQTGELVRKAQVSFVDTDQCLKIACLSDSQVLIALDAWQEGDPCLKLYQFPVQDPPHDWKGHSVAKRQRKFHIGEKERLAASTPDLVWSCRMAHTSDQIIAFAFKPVVGSSTNVASSDSECRAQSLLAMIRISAMRASSIPTGMLQQLAPRRCVRLSHILQHMSESRTRMFAMAALSGTTAMRTSSITTGALLQLAPRRHARLRLALSSRSKMLAMLILSRRGNESATLASYD